MTLNEMITALTAIRDLHREDGDLVMGISNTDIPGWPISRDVRVCAPPVIVELDGIRQIVVMIATSAEPQYEEVIEWFPPSGHSGGELKLATYTRIRQTNSQ